MHIYVGIRGLISAVKEWENFMSSQYLPFEILEKNKKGKLKKKPSPYLAQIQVREFKMYEIVCPKECEDKVMGMLKPTGGYGGMNRILKPFKMMMKLMGLKKCSTTWKPNILPNNNGMTIIAIGKKDDKMNWEPKKSKDVSEIGTPKEQL